VKLRFSCGACRSQYVVDEADVPERGGALPCSNCGNVIPLERAGGRPLTAPPASRPASAPARETTADRTSSEDPEVVCPRCGLHFVPRRGRGLASPGDAASRPVALVVEDMEYFLEIAREALRERFEVRSAAGVQEALDVLARETPQLIVLDPTLDGGSHGIGLLRTLRPKPCPILVFAAEDEADLYGGKWDQLRALGADDIVLKGMHAGETLARKAALLLDLPVGDDAG